MADYSPAGFGRAVQTRRKSLALQQEEFGMRVGYKPGPGAGVSVSRIESGDSLPPEARREAIAKELGLSLGELEALAVEESQSLTSPAPARGEVVARKLNVRKRAEALHKRIEERKEQMESLVAALELAHESASERFYLPFMKFAKTIDGAEVPQPLSTSELQVLEEAYTPAALAEIEVRTFQAQLGNIILGVAAGATIGGAAGGLLALGAYQYQLNFGVASTGMEIRLLRGIAQQNAALAAIGGGARAQGGGGIQGGISRLVATVALPLVAGAITGGILADQRRRKEIARLNEELDVIETELSDTEAGLTNLDGAIRRATETLTYISVHASHALEKWRGSFGEPPHTWEAMTNEQKQRFGEFIELAACELSIVGIETDQFLNLRGEELAVTTQATEAILSYTDDRVRTLV